MMIKTFKNSFIRRLFRFVTLSSYHGLITYDKRLLMHQCDIETLIHCTGKWRFRSAQHRYVAASRIQVNSRDLTFFDSFDPLLSLFTCCLVFFQCSRFMTFWHGSRCGSESPDPYLWLTDPLRMRICTKSSVTFSDAKKLPFPYFLMF